MYTLTALVKKDGTAVIRCPRCGGRQTVSLDTFKDLEGEKTGQCSCGRVFRVCFENRNAMRRETQIKGGYLNLRTRAPRKPVLVTNISLKGLGLLLFPPHQIRVGDYLLVTFILDDGPGTRIQARVRVCSVHERAVGCEFVDPEQYSCPLAAYLLS